MQSGFQPIPTGTTSVSISSDGQVTTAGSGGPQTFQVQLVRFANPAGLQSLGRNLFQETLASGTPETGNPDENGFGSLQQGYLEMSNVKVVEEMVNMIVAQRAYEVNSKAVQASDEMMQQATICAADENFPTHFLAAVARPGRPRGRTRVALAARGEGGQLRHFPAATVGSHLLRFIRLITGIRLISGTAAYPFGSGTQPWPDGLFQPFPTYRIGAEMFF